MFPWIAYTIENYEETKEARMQDEISRLNRELAELKMNVKQLRRASYLRRYEYQPLGTSWSHSMPVSHVVEEIMKVLGMEIEVSPERKTTAHIKKLTRWERLARRLRNIP